MSLPGAFKAQKKNGEIYYRSSFNFKNKHISLGSFETELEASHAYEEALAISKSDYPVDAYSSVCQYLSFNKYVSIINFRDKNIYIKTPIYLMNKYFIYYLSEHEPLKFDVDDLFYYSNHAIMRRLGHLFVADYGMQVNILSRYGIKSYAVPGRDYIFINGDFHDYRYGNIQIINRYYGVIKIVKNGRDYYQASINIVGNYLIGTYATEIEAAIAYNKSIDLLRNKGIKKAFQENYLEDLSAIEYAKIYNAVKISKRIRNYL